MKNIHALMIAITIGLSHHAHAAVELALTSSETEYALGESIEMRVHVSGLTQNAAPSLGDIDVNLHYDPSRFNFDGVIFGDAALGRQLNLEGYDGIFGSEILSGGTIHLFDISFDSPSVLDNNQADSFDVFRILFTPTTSGSADFLLTLNAMGDAYGNTLVPESLTDSRTINVAPVPVPAAFPLMLTTLSLLGLFVRKCKRKITR